MRDCLIEKSAMMEYFPVILCEFYERESGLSEKN